MPHIRERTVDGVMLEQRAAEFQTRSIKTTSKVAALELALSMVDLTTLEGKDSPEKVASLCAKAIRPFERDEELLGRRLPHVAAVCVYPSLVAAAKERLAGSGVKVASVATAFPSGQASLGVKLADTRLAVEAGADEIDMVIARGLFLAGRYDEVYHEIREVASACGPAHLKVILETGELGTYDAVRRASDIAIAALHDTKSAGAFIKTSTGKVTPASTMPFALVMLEALRDHYLATREVFGLKPAGGIRTAKQAVQYLVMVREVMGNVTGGPCPWLTPEWFRFGASTLANDLLRQLVRQATGSYPAAYDFSEA